MAKKNNRRGVEQVVLSPTRKPPAFITPMAAQVVKNLPEGDDWVYELKFDGYRALIRRSLAIRFLSSAIAFQL
jgi:ATP-dependent DNA ligase